MRVRPQRTSEGYEFASSGRIQVAHDECLRAAARRSNGEGHVQGLAAKPQAKRAIAKPTAAQKGTAM